MLIKKIPLIDLKKVITDQYDLFICSSSFEDRCKSIPNHIDVNRFDRSLILSNMNLREFVGKNKEFLENHFGEKSCSVEISTQEPLMTADNIQKAIHELRVANPIHKILIDVTTFTHESLLILFKLLQIQCPECTITITYASASEYSIGDEVKQKWLSRGVDEIRPILGYPGNIIPSQKIHLIVIVGYEHERAAEMIKTLEPNSIALGYGRSGTATTEKNKDANERYMELVKEIAVSYSQVETFEIPCNDPYGTKEKIEEQISYADKKNVLIAPMNNKLSTIGVLLALHDHKDVQLCYAQALRYNYFNYSLPGNQCYVFEMGNRRKIGEF